MVPSVLADTHTPTPTRTPAATHTRIPTPTGTIWPTPVLVGEILFSSARPSCTPGTSHIFVMKADGCSVRQITSGPGFDEWPEWNADKIKIVFTRDRVLHIMNADGSGVTALRPQGSQYYPTFSPDGSKIVYSEYIGVGTNLASYDLSSGQVAQLT